MIIFNEEYISMAEACALLQLTRATINRHVHLGRIKQEGRGYLNRKSIFVFANHRPKPGRKRGFKTKK
jgi:hypothetical protein